VAAVIAEGPGGHARAQAPAATPTPIIASAPAPLFRVASAPLRPLPLVRGPVVVTPEPILTPFEVPVRLAPATVIVRQEPVTVVVPAPAAQPGPTYAESEGVSIPYKVPAP
jgi:hypothetical protein